MLPLALIIGGQGELARHPLQLFIVEMPVEFQLHAMPRKVVVDVPDAVAQIGVHLCPHLVLVSPYLVKIYHRLVTLENFGFVFMS